MPAMYDPPSMADRDIHGHGSIASYIPKVGNLEPIIPIGESSIFDVNLVNVQVGTS